MWSQYIWFLTLLMLVFSNAKNIKKRNIQASQDDQLCPVKTPGVKSREKCEHYLKLREEKFGKEDRCKRSIAKKIVGGLIAEPGEFPHMALWGNTEKSKHGFECGASIISEKYLLTAAHCGNMYEGPMDALIGTNDASKGISIRILERIPHPDYDKTKFYNDVALLRLEKPLRFSKYIWPACLQIENYEEGTKAIASGWGNTIYGGKSSQLLRKVTLPIYDVIKCGEIYHRAKLGDPKALVRGIDEKEMMCAGGINLQKSICKGDSGGPFQIKKEKEKSICMYDIIGISSFAGECGVIPAVFVNVSNYIPWIESIVWPDTEEEKTCKLQNFKDKLKNIFNGINFK